MKFLEALDEVMAGEGIGMYRTSDPKRLITWRKSQFVNFYTSKIVEIDKDGLFANDWAVFNYNQEERSFIVTVDRSSSEIMVKAKTEEEARALGFQKYMTHHRLDFQSWVEHVDLIDEN